MSGFNRRFRRAMIAARKDPDAQALAELLQREGERLDDHEYLHELEQENKAINHILRQVEKVVVPQIHTYPERFESAMEAQALAYRVAELERLRPDIERLPESLLEAVDLAARLYGDRLSFSDEARKSAASAQFPDAGIAWRVLRSIALVLYDIYRTGCDLEVEFRNRSGFELALNETAGTRKHKDLYRKRMVRSGNRYIYSGGHIKFGTRPPKLLRVHFSYPPEAKTITIFHVGDHLATAGTKRGRGR